MPSTQLSGILRHAGSKMSAFICSHLRVTVIALLSINFCGAAEAQTSACRPGPHNILVLSNTHADTVAADFSQRMPTLNFSWFNANFDTPTLNYLNQFDAVLLFEDGNFANAPNVGNVLYQYYTQGNKGVVVGIFYWQDAKDSPEYGSQNFGWGSFEPVVPLVNVAGDEYRPRSLDASSIVTHPVTAGVSSLSVGGYAGSLKAAPGATVLAYWNENNDDGSRDTAVGILEQFGSRIVGVGAYPNYPYYQPNDPMSTFSGDYYQLWANALTWAAFGSGCDSTPPQVSCGAADAAWYNTDVTIACTASDPESGLANPAEASFNLTTNVPTGTEAATASTGNRQVCNTMGLCSTAGPITGNKVDKRAPTITVTSPAANATYQLNASVGSSYTCTDGGSGVLSCQGSVASGSPIDTSSTGSKTFTVTSTDNVGNSSTALVAYSVVSGGGGGQTAADVGITLSAPAKVSPGGTLTYSMTVTNAGKVTSADVVVSNALPAGTVFASASSSQGTVAAPAVGSNGTVTVNLGSLVKGATATISVVVTVTAASGTVLTDTATVSATTQDLNGSNNSATRKTTVSKN